MQDEKQFNQLMLQYEQLKNGSEEISRMIDNDDLDSAITMIKNREQLFLSCKCIQKYLELTPIQQTELNNILEQIRCLEMANIKKLEKSMAQVQSELKTFQQSHKIQQAYDINSGHSGTLINYEE